MQCTKCSTENRDGAKFCAKCGDPLAASIPPAAAAEMQLQPCPGCDKGCKPQAKFCPNCGYKFEMGNEPTAPAPAVNEPAPEPMVAKPTSMPEPSVTQPPAGLQSAAPRPVQPQADKTPAARSNNRGMLIGAGAVILLSLGASGYIIYHSRMAAANLPATAPTSAATQAVALPPPASQPVPAATPVATAVAAPTPPVVVPPTPAPVQAAAPAAPVLPHPEVAIAKPTSPPAPKHKDKAPAKASNDMQGAITEGLADARRCFDTKRYDCAISSAGMVLKFAPGNIEAVGIRQRAREAQERALSSIKID